MDDDWCCTIALAEVVPIITSHTSNVNISLSKQLGSSYFISEYAILSYVVSHKQLRNFAWYKEKTLEQL